MPCQRIHYKDSRSPELAAFLKKLASRNNPEPGENSVENEVRAILAAVRAKGDEALLEYSSRYDCPEQKLPLAVSAADLHQAAATVSRQDLDIIAEAAANIREFHEAQKERSWFITRPDGSILGQKVECVDRAGLYVPGGKGGDTPLISSLLMGAVPAQVAGVPSIAVISPPRADGTLNPHLLAAAYLLDINEIYAVGGPWGIGALAYGTREIAPVDVIAGPGNTYVTMAKRLVQGHVGIDMLAGPSEILILADDSAKADWLAVDMLSQAEHDRMASAVCITDSPHLADRLLLELANRIDQLPRADIARESLQKWGAIIVTPYMRDAVDLANAIAPEHLELVTRYPWEMLPAIRHAGAIFMGPHAPESVGDYFAGPNHVLPTMGTARFASALSVHTFTKRTSVVATSPAFLHQNAASIARLARLEGLEAHAQAAEIRKA